MNSIKRVSLDIILLCCTLGLFVLHYYTNLPNPLQLLTFKAMLISAGILHAHIARKLLFPKLDWNIIKLTAGHYITIAFYVVIIYCYAIGG